MTLREFVCRQRRWHKGSFIKQEVSSQYYGPVQPVFMIISNISPQVLTTRLVVEECPHLIAQLSLLVGHPVGQCLGLQT